MVVDKAPDAFRTISEVADDLDLPQHVLRFWETRFQQIKPLKRGGGRRYYRPDDIALLRGIQHLLYGEGYTIRGAQRILKDHGVKFVQNVWRPGADQPARAGQAAESELAAEPAPVRPPPERGRRAEADSAHRRLFGLLPSFLSSGIDEERLAESRAAEPWIVRSRHRPPPRSSPPRTRPACRRTSCASCRTRCASCRNAASCSTGR